MNKDDIKICVKLPAVPKTVYETMLDPSKICFWRAPKDMECTLHEFQPFVGGWIRISLTYLDDTQVGKTGEHTDTYHGRFMELKPYEKIVEELQFESAEESLKNRMTLTFLLEEIEEGTKLTVIHEGLPESISMKDNELGWLEALEQLRKILLLKEETILHEKGMI
ncbi:SRPBCC domain-containing protein [Proteiniclasticum ruminis]|uniref:SRPBCC domain-containing protein n=1 Tax=Proteiniclasticum ruminis TaxID=398199 RepID=UPI0028B0371A|nr:SRPBCC domain-containing protein [Proteiniclasticum ruminis]